MLHAFLYILSVAAQPAAAACTGPLSRSEVIECARASSPELVAERASEDVTRTRVDAARVALPSNPTLAVTVGRRWNTVGDTAINVTGTLTQRVEIGGQRRKRIAVARAEVDAAQQHTAATDREVVGRALLAYFDVLAAREELAVVERGRATAERLEAVAQARAEGGLASPVDVELAAAERTRLDEHRALAAGRVKTARVRLAASLGLDPTATLPDVRGELRPLPTPADLETAAEGATQRPELARHLADKRVHEAEIRRLKRERVPTPSLSIFAQTDGFNERVIGGGLSMPIPLPFPAGRTYRAQIDEARAKVRESEARLATTERDVGLEVAIAYHELQARREAAAVYSDASRSRTRETLEDLSEEIELGHLPVREALTTQQSLLDLLLRGVESRHALCRASVLLALADGRPLEGRETSRGTGGTR